MSECVYVSMYRCCDKKKEKKRIHVEVEIDLFFREKERAIAGKISKDSESSGWEQKQ